MWIESVIEHTKRELKLLGLDHVGIDTVVVDFIEGLHADTFGGDDTFGFYPRIIKYYCSCRRGHLLFNEVIFGSGKRN